MAQPATSMAAARNRPKPSWLVGLLASVLLAAATFLPAQGASLLNKLTLKQPAGCTPQQVLLSLGSDAQQMHISWKTEGPNCPSQVVYQRLSEQGSSSQQQQQEEDDHQQPLTLGMDNTAQSVGFSYLLSERDMCDDPAASNTFLWHLHRATLSDLEPSASYRYRIEGAAHNLFFRAAPAPSPDAKFTFLGFGDMGDARHPTAKSPGAASTLLRLRREVEDSHRPAQLLLHVGDLSYANGDPEVWDSFFEGLQPFAAGVPYMISMGNHEYGYTSRKGGSKTLTDPSGALQPYQPSWGNFGPDSKGECGVTAARRFHMPDRPGRRDLAPFWYAFDYGSVHFTVLSTEHSLVPGSRQYEWLEEELAAVDRCTTPWLVVLLHRPMYVVYPHKSNREVGDHVRAQIEPLLLQHKVDLTIAGHVHSYYRTCAVQDEECVEGPYDTLRTKPTPAAAGAAPAVSGSNNNPNAAAAAVAQQAQQQQAQAAGLGRGRHGIVHFVIGSAGRKLSDVGDYQEDWCTSAVQQWGYGRFTVRGSSSLLVEYVSSETGEVLDSVELEAEGSRGRSCAANAGTAAS